jgi:hypothetical protein
MLVYIDFLTKLDSSNDETFLILESTPSDLKELISADALRVAYPRVQFFFFPFHP